MHIHITNLPMPRPSICFPQAPTMRYVSDRNAFVPLYKHEAFK